MMKLKTFFTFLLACSLSSCKDHYNDTIEWMNHIEKGSTIEEVKKSQPSFVEVDWNNPHKFDEEMRFVIKKIKGNKDILHMSHELVFRDNKYVRYESNK